MEINWFEAAKIFTIGFILLLITDCLKQLFLKNKQAEPIKEQFSFVGLLINAVSALVGTLIYTVISIYLNNDPF